MRRASALGVALALVLGLFCLCYTQRGREAGWQVLEGAPPARQFVTWPGVKITPKGGKRMAKASIKSIQFSASYDLWIRYRSDRTDQGGFESGGGGGISVMFAGEDGGYFYYMAQLDPPDYFVLRLPVSSETGLVEGGFHYRSVSDKCYLGMESGSQPIGNKGPTHAKEMTVTESWQDVTGAQTTFTVTPIGAGEIGKGTTAASWVPMDTFTLVASGNWQSLPFAASFDPDDWSGLDKYAVSFNNISFCGETVDLSELTARNFGNTTDVWVEGTKEGTIGFWGQSNFTNYLSWPGGTLTAPFSYDFSNYVFKNMDGSDIDPAQKVYCTGIRTLDENGVDVGPWHGSIAELRALGRYKQKHGLWRDN